jgi:uncharacterized protein YjbI with pentapeptide repeats
MGEETEKRKKLLGREEVITFVKEGRSLKGVDLSGADLRGLDLQGGDFQESRLRYADLSGADLRGANFRKANLRHARLVGADLRYADLREADLSHADLHNAILGETLLEGAVAYNVIGVRKDVVFFPTSLLTQLLRKPGYRFGDEVLEISGEPTEQYRLVPAYRIVEPIPPSSKEDPFVGQVFTIPELRSKGATLEKNQIFLGDKLYRGEEGYLGRPSSGTVRQYIDPSLLETQEKGKDLKLLEEFLLKKL